MNVLPIEPHLIDLLRVMDARGFRLVIAGGTGLYLKRRWIEQQARTTLFVALPDARATEDIDSFLTLDVFLKDQQTQFREVLTDLGFVAFAKARYFQFIKADPRFPSGEVKVDLHARLPEDHESGAIKIQEPRLGRQGHTAFRTLHAFATPEAFAVEHGVQELPLVGADTSGTPHTGVVRVPHPFASLCMKLTAASDHERTPPVERAHKQRKHAYDVYLLVAMLGEAEVAEVRAYTREFARHEAMAAIRRAVSDYFAEPDAPGCRTIRDQLRNEPSEPADLAQFCEVLRELFEVV